VTRISRCALWPRAGDVDDRGRKSACRAGDSIEVLGFAMSPAAGDTFTVVEDERKALIFSSIRQDRLRTKQLSQTNRVPSRIVPRISAGEVKDLNLVIKAECRALSKRCGMLSPN